MQDPASDDVDRLFARAGSVEPPLDLFDRVMAQTQPAAHIKRLPLYLAAYLLALAGLLLLAYELGAAAVRSGATTLIATVVGNLTLLTEAPAGYLGALLSSIPWGQATGLLIDLAILAIITRLLLSGIAESGRRSAGAEG